jgi:hypothetical protein
VHSCVWVCVCTDPHVVVVGDEPAQDENDEDDEDGTRSIRRVHVELGLMCSVWLVIRNLPVDLIRASSPSERAPRQDPGDELLRRSSSSTSTWVVLNSRMHAIHTRIFIVIDPTARSLLLYQFTRSIVNTKRTRNINYSFEQRECENGEYCILQQRRGF